MLGVDLVVVFIVGTSSTLDSHFKHNTCLQASYSDVKKFGGTWYCVKLQDGHLYGTELPTLTEMGE